MEQSLGPTNFMMIKKVTKTYPEVVGALIGTLLLLVVVFMAIWAPRLSRDWETNTLVRDIWFTLTLLVVSLARFWPLRRKRAFWIVLATVFVIHSAAMWGYRTYFQPLRLDQAILVLLLEGLALFFLIPWATSTQASGTG